MGMPRKPQAKRVIELPAPASAVASDPWITEI